MDNQLTVQNQGQKALTPLESLQQGIDLLKIILKTILREGDDYGKIIGCGQKKVLLKPGAEKICAAFKLAPTFVIKQVDHPKGHREYEALCTLTHMPSGTVVGNYAGMCSTMEKKYAFRKDGSANQFLADQYNTVLKMAEKRALVAAVLVCTNASDIFTQDLDETFDETIHYEPEPEPAPPKPDPERIKKVWGEVTDVLPALMEASGLKPSQIKITKDAIWQYAKSKPDLVTYLESNMEEAIKIGIAAIVALEAKNETV